MLLSEQEYRHAAELLSGHTERDPLLQEFGDWFRGEFGLQVYDYICGETNAGGLRLKVVLWDRGSRRKMMKGANLDSGKQERIGRKFSELCRKYRVHEAYYRSGSVWVCYDTLKDEVEKRTLKQAESRIKAIRMKDVCRVEIVFNRVHIFFETEEQRERHMRDGVCGEVNRQVSSMVKEYDRFGVFPDGVCCEFTSLQTLNEKYEGNLFYYTR